VKYSKDVEVVASTRPAPTLCEQCFVL